MKFGQRSRPQCRLKGFSFFERVEIWLRAWASTSTSPRLYCERGRVIDRVPPHQCPTKSGGGSGTHFEKIQYSPVLLFTV